MGFESQEDFPIKMFRQSDQMEMNFLVAALPLLKKLISILSTFWYVN